MIEPEDKVTKVGSDSVFTVRQYIGSLAKFLIELDSDPAVREWVSPEEIRLMLKADPFGNGWPRVVYHYTSLDTMMKIIDKGQIWATGTAYLNDTQERREFLEAIQRRLPSFAASHADYDSTISMPVWHEQALKDLPFVACFSSDSDSLYQWRSYSPSSQGVCIGFRVAALMKAKIDKTPNAPWRRLEAFANVHFSKVHYLPNDNAEHVDKVLEEYWLRAHSEQEHSVHGQTVSSVFLYSLWRAAALFKNAAFSLENEFRLLVPSVSFDPSVLRARQTRSSLAPYLALDIPSVSGDLIRRLEGDADGEMRSPRWDAIERIVVGPAIDRQATKTSVELYLSSRNVQANVDVSAIPFRDW